MRRGRLQTAEGCCLHLTQRCHDRQYLLRFARDRRRYVARLREMSQRFAVEVLDYMVTSNHVHLLVWAGRGGAEVSAAMRFLQGAAARDYNRRKERSGSFWSDRYHPTLVETGVHLSRCLFYVDLNMVRAGVVRHPAEWAACGYHELAGRRQRYRVVNLPRLLWCLEMPGREAEFRAWYQATVDDLMRSAYRVREPVWSESVAVGSQAWVEGLASRIIVGRKAIVPLEALSGLGVAEGNGSYALRVSRRAFDPLREGVAGGAPAGLAAGSMVEKRI